MERSDCELEPREEPEEVVAEVVQSQHVQQMEQKKGHSDDGATGRQVEHANQ